MPKKYRLSVEISTRNSNYILSSEFGSLIYQICYQIWVHFLLHDITPKGSIFSTSQDNYIVLISEGIDARVMLRVLGIFCFLWRSWYRKNSPAQWSSGKRKNKEEKRNKKKEKGKMEVCLYITKKRQGEETKRWMIYIKDKRRKGKQAGRRM